MVVQWIANPRPSGLAGSIPAVGVRSQDLTWQKLGNPGDELRTKSLSWQEQGNSEDELRGK